MEPLKIEEQEQELVLVLAWSLGEQLCLGPQMFHGRLSTRQTGSHHTVPRSVSQAPMYLRVNDVQCLSVKSWSQKVIEEQIHWN